MCWPTGLELEDNARGSYAHLKMRALMLCSVPTNCGIGTPIVWGSVTARSGAYSCDQLLYKVAVFIGTVLGVLPGVIAIIRSHVLQETTDVEHGVLFCHTDFSSSDNSNKVNASGTCPVHEDNACGHVSGWISSLVR